MENTNAALLVKTPVPIPRAVVCSMSIPKKNLRTFPGTVRGTEEWDDTYKIRVTVEKSINHFKDSFCVAGRKTRNALTSEADLYLAGITQLVTVILADSIHQHKYIRSLKPLISA